MATPPIHSLAQKVKVFISLKKQIHMIFIVTYDINQYLWVKSKKTYK